MPGLEGTVKTPFGMVQKKTALITGGIVVGLGVIVYWREKKLGGLTSSATTTTGEIDPATGFVYGTPEDLAALAAQGTSLGGGGVTSSGGGGSGSIPDGGIIGTGFTSNGQWVQAVEEYMQANNLIADPTQLSAALGKYITGTYIDPNSAAYSLVQQAISVKDYPPIAGANGYPPAINTHPGTTTPPVTTPGTPKPPVTPPKVLPKRRYVVVTKFVTSKVLWSSTLSGIAGRSHRTVSQLASWNGISNPNVIGTGKHIWIDPATGFSGSVEWKG
jgi:LysM repeat protein